MCRRNATKAPSPLSAAKQRELDEKFRDAAHHNPHHVVEAEPWRAAVENERYRSQGAHHHFEASEHDPAAFAAAAAAASASQSPITKKHYGPKSKEERDAAASGFRTGAFVGTVLAGPVGAYVGGAMGAAHAKKQEQKAYDKGKHERHEDLMKDKATRAAKNGVASILRGGI